MTRYEIIIVKSVLKQLEPIPVFYRKKIMLAIDGLSFNPRPPGCEKLTNRKNEYRIRVGVYRIIYSVFDKELIVDIVDIDHRKQVYR